MTAPFALHSIVCINWHKLFYPQFIISLHHKIRFKMHDLDLRVLTELKYLRNINIEILRINYLQVFNFEEAQLSRNIVNYLEF